MTDSQPIQSGGGDNLPTFIRRNNHLYLSKKNTLVISGTGTTTNSVFNDHKDENIDIESGVDVMQEEKSIMKKGVRVFPPVLTSLNRNGRRGFSLESVRTQGRLQIMVVPNHFSEVVRTSEDGDRVSMGLLETGDHR